LLWAHIAIGRPIAVPITRPLASGETAFLEVVVGELEHGVEIDVRREDGRLIGVISPFGARSSKAGGTYSIPIPAELLVGTSLALVFVVEKQGCPNRPPTRKEIPNVRLRYVRTIATLCGTQEGNGLLATEVTP
jgi:hypothetical protein